MCHNDACFDTSDFGWMVNCGWIEGLWICCIKDDVAPNPSVDGFSGINSEWLKARPIPNGCESLLFRGYQEISICIFDLNLVYQALPLSSRTWKQSV